MGVVNGSQDGILGSDTYENAYVFSVLIANDDSNTLFDENAKDGDFAVHPFFGGSHDKHFWYVNGNNISNNYASSGLGKTQLFSCLLYTSPSPRDRTRSRMPSSA